MAVGGIGGGRDGGIAGGGETGMASDGVSPQTPVGRSSNNMQVARPDGATALNAPAVINGRYYTGHALDQMQSRGIVPSTVEDAIGYGDESVGKYDGTTAYYDPLNNLSVIVDSGSGRVITTSWGLIKQ